MLRSFAITPRRVLAFLLLCLLAGSQWILDLAAPRPLPAILGLALRLAVCAGVFAVMAVRTAGAWPGLRLSLWGAVFLSALPLAYVAAAGSVSNLTAYLVPAFLPAFLVFFDSQGRSTFGQDRSSFRLLVPALAGLAGAALLVSYTIPSSVAGLLWLALLIAASACTAAAILHLHRMLQAVSLLRSAAVVSGAGALVCFAFTRVGYTGMPVLTRSGLLLELARLLVLDGPMLLLSLWLIRELRPIQFSVRFLLVILVGVTESFVIARPGLDWTLALGVLLLGGACFVLFREGSDTPA